MAKTEKGHENGIMDKKTHNLFFGESPFSPSWDINFRWKQQNSLIGGYKDPKKVGKNIPWGFWGTSICTRLFCRLVLLYSKFFLKPFFFNLPIQSIPGTRSPDVLAINPSGHTQSLFPVYWLNWQLASSSQPPFSLPQGSESTHQNISILMGRP